MNMRTLIKSSVSILFVVSFTLRTEFITITSADQFNKLIDEKKPLVLKFSAAYCPPCKITKVPFQEVSKEEEFKNISFIELDIQSPAGSPLSTQFKILGVPTFIFIKDGKEVKRIVGLEHPAKFKDDLRSQLREVFINASTTNNAKDEEIMKIEVEEEVTTPQPSQDAEKPLATEEATGFLMHLWLSVQAFFIFIFDKIKEVITYVIDLIKGIFGGK